MRRPAVLVGGVLALAGAGAALVSRGAGVAAPPQPIACAFAVMVAGELRCDEAAPRTIAALCGGPAGPPLRHGDAVEPAALCAADERRPGGPGWGRMRGEDLAALEVPVDINTASLAELESLPEIGPSLARAIAAARPFARVEELARVPGIGPRRLAALRRRARVDEGR